MASQAENTHPNTIIRGHYHTSVPINNDQKRRKVEANSNNITAYPSAAIHATKVSKRTKRRTNKRSNQRREANVFAPQIFNHRPAILPTSTKKASKKRRLESDPPSQEKKMRQELPNNFTSNQSAVPAQKKKRAQKNSRNNDAPIFRYKHHGEVATPTIAPPTATASKAKVSKKRRSDAHESPPPAQKKKMTAPAQKLNTIDRGQVPSAYQFTTNTTNKAAVPVQEKNVLQNQPFVNNVSSISVLHHRDEVANGATSDLEFAYSDSDSDSEEEHLVVGMTLLPDADDAATVIQAFFRGASARTMKPRARPQAELKVDSNHGQEWDGNSDDDAAPDDDSVEEVEVFLVVEAEEGDEKAEEVDFVDAAEAVDEGDEIEEEAVVDNDKPAAKIQTAFKRYLARKSAIKATERRRRAQPQAEFDARAVEEEVVEEEEEDIYSARRNIRRRRMVKELQCTLDGWYWTRRTQRRKIRRD